MEATPQEEMWSDEAARRYGEGYTALVDGLTAAKLVERSLTSALDSELGKDPVIAAVLVEAREEARVLVANLREVLETFKAAVL